MGIAGLRRADVAMGEGNRLLAWGRYLSAASKFRIALALSGSAGTGAAARSKLTAIQEEGLKRLEEASRLLDAGSFAAARDLAEKTKNQFGNVFGGVRGGERQESIPVLSQALISMIDGNPRIKMQMKEDDAAQQAEKLDILEDKAAKNDRGYYDLYRALERIARRFSDCPTGRRCAERLAELRRDKKLYKIIQREGDRRLIRATLQLADQHSKNGRGSDAEAELDQLRQKFPGVSLASLRQRAE
jgi:hypothetical protein